MAEGRRKVPVLQVTAPGQVCWVDVVQGPLKDGWMRLDTIFSGISTGTELSFLKGTNPVLSAGWDAELGLFRPAGRGVSGSEPLTSAYPVAKLGYMQVGRVVASRTPHARVGDVVAATYGHAAGHDLDPLTERFVVLPPEMDPLLGIFVAHMGPICANGVLHASADLHGTVVGELAEGLRGRRVLVLGAGVVGLLTALFAAQARAAEVVVADPTPDRLSAASALGLAVLDSSSTDIGLWAKERWRHDAGDRGADVTFQCRGQAWSLQAALRALRPQGTVIDLAFYPGGSDELRLGEEFHHNGLRIVSAQIGRVPRGLGHAWDRERLSAATLELLAARGDDVRTMITDQVPMDQAPGLYAELLHRERHVLQAVIVP